jgi:ABC-type spermidine/putrescine transport system permease subunit II
MTVASIRNSLLFSSVAVVANLLLGVSIAFLVVRSKLRGAGILDALSMIPLAVPGLVMAFGYLAISSWLSNLGWVRSSAFWTALFDVRVNPTLFLVVAYAVRRLPYMVRSAVAGLQQTSEAFEEAAWNLGASPARTARAVTLPLIAANLVAGLLLAFAFSMLEVSDSLMLAQQARYYPITKTIYELFQLLGTLCHVGKLPQRHLETVVFETLDEGLRVGEPLGVETPFAQPVGAEPAGVEMDDIAGVVFVAQTVADGIHLVGREVGHATHPDAERPKWRHLRKTC